MTAIKKIQAVLVVLSGYMVAFSLHVYLIKERYPEGFPYGILGFMGLVIGVIGGALWGHETAANLQEIEKKGAKK